MNYSITTATKLLNAMRKNKRVVLTSGVFDIFHIGHISYLQKCKTLGDILVIHIDGNTLVKKHKGLFRPYVDEKKRADLIQSLGIADIVYISNAEPNDKKIIQTIQPDVIAKVNRGAKDDAERKTLYEKIIPNAQIVFIPPIPDISSSDVVANIQETTTQTSHLSIGQKRLLQAARKALPHGYSYSGLKIGAAVLDTSGKIYTSCNISNASPVLACCAERLAIYKAVENGARIIQSIAIVTAEKQLVYPCGACRQIILEFSGKNSPTEIILSSLDSNQVILSTIARLYPHPFINQRARVTNTI